LQIETLKKVGTKVSEIESKGSGNICLFATIIGEDKVVAATGKAWEPSHRRKLWNAFQAAKLILKLTLGKELVSS